MINSNYTFDSFIGDNRLKKYFKERASDIMPNICPIFIYGQTSSGKTHIAQAIYNRFNNLNSEMFIKYMPMQLFLNDCIDAVVNNNEKHFVDSFKNIDLLIIDDIHLLERKEISQKCLGKIVDVLILSNKLLVFTSLLDPKQLTDFNQQIRSQLLSGLVIELTNPNLESKITILQVKALDIGLDISVDLLKIICERTDLDLRVLGGIIKTIKYNSQTHKLDEKLISKILSRY